MRLVLPVLLGILLLFGTSDCSPPTAGSVSSNALKVSISPSAFVAVSAQYNDSLNAKLTSKLASVANSTASSLRIQVTGCLSNYNLQAITITPDENVNLFNGDRNCILQLISFEVGTSTFSLSGANAVQFDSWATGGIATFQNTEDANQLIKVRIAKQLSIIQPSNEVVFNFSDIFSPSGESTTSQAKNAEVSAQIDSSAISASGIAAPDLILVQARFLSTNSPSGTGNYSFTLRCGDPLTYTAPNYFCSGVDLSSNIDYILIDDTFSHGPISVADANDAFATNTPTSVSVSNIVIPGGSDAHGNTLVNGGFYTSDTTPLLGSPLGPSGSSYVLLLRRTDLNGNAMSYVYFYFVVSPLTQQ